MKNLFFCIVLFFGTHFTGVASAQSDMFEAQDPPVWRVDAHPHGIFSYTYSWNECSVKVRSAGAGLLLEAVDPNWRGMHVTQNIYIERQQGGGFFKLAFVRETEKRNTGSVLAIDTEGYDIFEVKCVEAVKSLPKGIQKAFHGFYGIGGN